MKLIESVRETAKVIKTLSRKPRRQPPKRMQAKVRATTTASADEYEEDEEPQTKLTSAFIVVLILHVVAVGGIYAFKEIKANRRNQETARAEQRTKNAKPATAGGLAAATDASNSTESDAQGSPANPSLSPAGSAPSGAKPRTYMVKPGDTLLGIAKVNGMTMTDLKAINNLPSDSIRPGKVLNLTAAKAPPAPVNAETPVERTEPAEVKGTTKPYTIKSGDRLIFIAKRFNVTQEELIKENNIKDPTKLQIGKTLKIPAKK